MYYFNIEEPSAYLLVPHLTCTGCLRGGEVENNDPLIFSKVYSLVRIAHNKTRRFSLLCVFD